VLAVVAAVIATAGFLLGSVIGNRSSSESVDNRSQESVAKLGWKTTQSESAAASVRNEALERPPMPAAAEDISRRRQRPGDGNHDNEKVGESPGESRGAQILHPKSKRQERFRASRVVEENCLRDGNGRCDDPMFLLVQRMNEEPRDDAWASEAEARLRRTAQAQDAALVVRQVQCRASICALEVASASGAYHGAPVDDIWLEKNLELWDRTNGYEFDEQGRKLAVTLGVYKRRAKD
jgi:hypothetical protein